MRNKTWMKLLAGFFCVALLIGALPMQQAHAESTLATGFVNTTKLNLRKGAGTNNAIVTTLDVNTVVNIYEVKGTWLRVDVPSKGKSGYVSGKYITVDSTSLSAYALASTNARVNLRKEATSKSESFGLLAKGTSLTIYSVDSKTGWYQVKVHSTGKEGYVYPSYVSIASKVGSSSGSTGSTGTTATKGEITANGVNLRSGPGTNYSKIDKLQKLDTVSILEKNGDWYKVTVDAINKTGYVYASFVKVTSTSPTATPGPTTPTPVPTATPAGSQAGKLNADGVNFRTGPGTSYPSNGKLSKGTLVTVLSKSGDWYKLTVNSTGKTGYVFAKYITIIAVSPTPTVKPTVTPTPATPTPATPTPATPTPATPTPATPTPATPSPATPSPATPVPGTPTPVTP